MVVEDRKRIVIVDDYVPILRVLEALLYRHQVKAVFDNIDGALAWDRWDEVDVAIVDYNLPGRTGAELLAWLAEHHPEVRRVMVSVSNAVPAEGQVHVDVFIDKLDLVARIDEIVNGGS